MRKSAKTAYVKYCNEKVKPSSRNNAIITEILKKIPGVLSGVNASEIFKSDDLKSKDDKSEDESSVLDEDLFDFNKDNDSIYKNKYPSKVLSTARTSPYPSPQKMLQKNQKKSLCDKVKITESAKSEIIDLDDINDSESDLSSSGSSPNYNEPDFREKFQLFGSPKIKKNDENPLNHDMETQVCIEYKHVEVQTDCYTEACKKEETVNCMGKSESPISENKKNEDCATSCKYRL